MIRKGTQKRNCEFYDTIPYLCIASPHSLILFQMKKLLFLSAFAFIILHINLKGQCTSCTTTITGLDATNHIISAGQTFCISSTGICTGLITVSGGTLCNQGHIGSSNVWVTGATSVFNNLGTINSSNILVDNGASFTNGGTATIDSLLITNPNSTFWNGVSMTTIRLAITDSAQCHNSGTIATDFLGDSLGFVYNISSCILVNYDFYNIYNSFYINDNAGCLYVNRDWFNTTGSTFSSYYGTANVVRNWYNSALFGGEISVGNISDNAGTIGTLANNVNDICDAGHPVGGLDVNTGTIVGTLTTCQSTISYCQNNCGISSLIAEQSKQPTLTLFPNPASTSLNITLSAFTPNQQLIITDVLGRQISKFQISNSKSEINVSEWNNGVYFYQLINNKDTEQGKFIVNH